MSTVLEKPTERLYSPRNTIKLINFFCAAPAARSVFLSGDFNDWNPIALPLQRRPDGWWAIQVALTHGHHHYLFLVDGRPTLDPHATEMVSIDRYSQVSVIAVS